MPISFSFPDIPCPISGRRKIAAWLRSTIEREGLRCGQIAIVFGTDAFLLDMNRQFLGHDYYTDVITFDYTDGTTVAGDIYISVDTVADNARQYGVSTRQEMLRVIVHGVLHLCGYGDKQSQQQKVMSEKEDFYLGCLDS